MNKFELKEIIEEQLAAIPEKMSGNEFFPVIGKWLVNFLPNERQAIDAVLRDYMAFRISTIERSSRDAIAENRLWMALDLAKQLQLEELLSDMETLLLAVRNGEVLRPIHESSVQHYLNSLK